MDGGMVKWSNWWFKWCKKKENTRKKTTKIIKAAIEVVEKYREYQFSEKNSGESRIKRRTMLKAIGELEDILKKGKN